MQGRAIVVGVLVRIRGWLECDDQQLAPRQYNFTN
jgi:hypothetical protein